MLIAAGVAAGATLAIDQLSKAVVRATVPEWHPLDGSVGITHQRNYGSAYAFLPAVPAWGAYVGSALVGAGAFAAGARFSSNPVLAAMGAGMMFGGGVGNAIDRSRQGYVTDFIHTSDLFGVYNLADASLMSGAGLIGLSFMTRS